MLQQAELFGGELDNGPIESARRILCEAVKEYEPSGVYGLFSGGHDSLCACHVASRVLDGYAGTVHINTGIGVPDTRRFVRETCDRLGWDLMERTPPELSYREMCARYGMPGPGCHTYAYSWLKQRTLAAFIHEVRTGRGDKPMLVSGVRLAESNRRMAFASETYVPTKQVGQVFVAPLLYWEDSDKEAYMERHDLRRNPVADWLGFSGECLCGAYARPGERETIRQHWPSVEREISDCERLARENGEHDVWGVAPPNSSQDDESQLLCIGCQGGKT